MQPLLLCVTYTTKPGMRDKFIQEVRSSGVLDEILAEHGCLGYVYYCSALEKDKILLVEKWDTEEHQKFKPTEPLEL